jgi:hypothetical protein
MESLKAVPELSVNVPATAWTALVLVSEEPLVS